MLYKKPLTSHRFVDGGWRFVAQPPTANHESLTATELHMRKVVMTLVTFALGAAFAAFFLNGRNTAQGQAPAPAATGFSAVPGAIGSQDVTGPYDVVKG